MDEEPLRPNCLMLQKISFGLGHIFNDLCAAMWFSYTLFYFQVVLGMKSTTAGTLLMIGQVVDSVATPVAGWAIDYTSNRRLWHFCGTISVAIGFSLIYSLRPSEFGATVFTYYVVVIALFQIGWAIVQISHLSLIPEISTSHSHSSDLTAIRYTASVCCSMTLYIVTLIILENNDTTKTIGPDDFFKFKRIALILIFIGILASLFFYCGLLGTYESEYEAIRINEQDDVNHLTSNSDKHFLKQWVIYLVALMYMASRLFTTLNLIYIPLYLDERGEFELMEKEKLRQTIASIPLVSYIASFLTSILLRYRFDFCTDKITYLTGALIGISASIWIGAGLSLSSDVELYLVAIFLGVSGSATMVASLCLTANLVKTNGYGGGSVYSIVTFTDKLISGGAVVLIQNLQCDSRELCPHYYENVLSYICGVVSFVGLLSLVYLEIQIRKNQQRRY